MQVKYLSKNTPVQARTKAVLPIICASMVFSVLFSSQTLMAAPVQAVVNEQQQFELDIPAQNLASALQALSVASRHQVSAASSVLKGEASLPVKGSYTVLQALKAMIKGSDLLISKIGTNSYTLIMSDSAPEQARVRVEEVMVTGQKITRSLQDTPTSIAVLSEIQMEEQNITDFRDVLLQTANAHSDRNGSFSIRGINGSNVSGGGNSFLASVYVDGASLPRSLISGGAFSTWDASQVEILRGPQSTLQGRNSLAGAVVVNTQAPTQEWEGKYRVQAGEEAEKEAAIAFGGGLIDDVLAFRFSGEKKEFDGFNTNITRNEPSDYKDTETYRLKFLLTPNSLPDFSAQLNFTHGTNTRGTSLGVNVPVSGSPFNQRIVTSNELNETDISADVVALLLAYDINDHWSSKAISTWSDVDTHNIADRDKGPAAIASSESDSLVETLSQEFQLVFEYDQFSGIIGTYYSDLKTRNSGDGLAARPLSQAGLTVNNLVAQFGALGVTPQVAAFIVNEYAISGSDPSVTRETNSSQQNVESYAVFTDMSYAINEQWDVYAGLRWDHEVQENSSKTDVVLVNGHLVPNPANYGALAPIFAGLNALGQQAVNNAINVAPLDDASFSTVLPKIGLSYHWNDDLTTSFTVQKGYRSGGVGINAAFGTTHQFEPEYTTNYEFSLRSSWLDGALIANANVFYIDWKDQQVSTQLGFSQLDKETRNAGKSTVEGLELELTYQASDALKLYTSIGQSKSEFKEFTIVIPTATNPIIFDLAGRGFAGSPEWTGNVGATYGTGNGLFSNINVNYASDTQATINPFAGGLVKGDPGFDPQDPGRTLVNLQVGYEWDSVGIYLLGRNIFNKEYIRSTGTQFLSLSDPRQVSLSIRGTF